MSVYRTLILAGVLALSANAAMARGGGGHDGKANQRVRDEIYNTTPAPMQPSLLEGRASTEGRASVRTYRRGYSGPTSTEAADY